MPFVPYLLIAKVAVVLALLGGAAFGVHSYNSHQQDIGYQRAVAEYAAKLEEAKANAKAVEAALNQKIQEANNAANRRNKQIDAAHAAATAANDSLRSAIDSLGNSVSGATASSLANAVVATGSLLGDCSTKYVGMAEKADRHANDAKRLQEGWPDYAKIGEKK